MNPYAHNLHSPLDELDACPICQSPLIGETPEGSLCEEGHTADDWSAQVEEEDARREDERE